MERFLDDYSGFCNFNYKVHRDGKLCLFEINARVGADLACDAPSNWPEITRAMFEKLDAIGRRLEFMEGLDALGEWLRGEAEKEKDAEGQLEAETRSIEGFDIDSLYDIEKDEETEAEEALKTLKIMIEASSWGGVVEKVKDFVVLKNRVSSTPMADDFLKEYVRQV
eukprot:gnl/TRDRNA2_/TRDRNA2_161162_c0_seq3.p3 gnl/TRDRNA2_/TRDRNA2_161162_c0~~gnl/TRDRNA2_/TRDRNA2_161162_c0_seq3.p3  ORF type:complete len:167 (+),score=39.07 gnl/TRDRNA2_/TRDRNA2_161162_c0_seq3:724-1224(+)